MGQPLQCHWYAEIRTPHQSPIVTLSSVPGVSKNAYFVRSCLQIFHPTQNLFARLLNTAESVFDSLHSTIMYYSTWAHLKELVVVPYEKRSSIKSTVFKSKAGTTTILISSMEDGKAKKTSSQSKGSVRSETDRSSDTGSSRTANSERQAKLTTQFHKPDETRTSSSKTTTNPKKVIFEEVSYAREVEDYLMNEVYFAQSKVPRDTRSSIKYSVGQLVRHKTAEYVGVIIGWDNVAKVVIDNTCR